MEPDETSQMRSLTWIITVRCSAYCLNKLSSSVLTLLVLVSMEPDGDLSNEESHLDQYCQMFCILLEQVQFQCSHMTCLVSIELVETSQMRSLTWISTVKCSAYYLNKLSSSVLTRLVWSVQTQMRPLKWEVSPGSILSDVLHIA